ncbi:hypothetical protein LPMP_310960 [Leishmania panamensis]|uniref:Uncharacterized protein n=2 Tax=Leishmania guyanensis species complex TaxID=38579 RepID=A0A088RXI2_LEIPA|nr:hypothetical protein LPMP_310960 [Leishmania panamensis]AIO00684.1 hypothetical protein LPMP_310960 [Leishmania panamensis]
MTYDANMVNSTACDFDRGYMAECTLNDVLLVVSSSGGATTPNTAKGASSKSGGCCGGGSDDCRMRVANNALTSFTVRLVRTVAAMRCGCGCSGVSCCSCYKCWMELPESIESAACTGGGVSPEGCAIGAAGAVIAAGGCTNSSIGDAGSAMAAYPSGYCGDSTATQRQPRAALSTFADLQTLLVHPGNDVPLDAMQKLASAFQGLGDCAGTHKGQLDKPSIGRQAEAMVLAVMHHTSHLAPDTRIQGILCELKQLLAFLDSNAAVTDGAAQTGSGDCTTTLPQHVMQVRMLANIAGAVLCLLRRSAEVAMPYVRGDTRHFCADSALRAAVACSEA